MEIGCIKVCWCGCGGEKSVYGRPWPELGEKWMKLFASGLFGPRCPECGGSAVVTVSADEDGVRDVMLD